MQAPPAAVEITEYPDFQSAGCGLVVIAAYQLVIPPATANALTLALQLQLLTTQVQQIPAYLDRAGFLKQP